MKIKEKQHIISKINPGSIAEEMEIEPGGAPNTGV